MKGARIRFRDFAAKILGNLMYSRYDFGLYETLMYAYTAGMILVLTKRNHAGIDK